MKRVSVTSGPTTRVRVVVVSLQSHLYIISFTPYRYPVNTYCFCTIIVFRHK